MVHHEEERDDAILPTANSSETPCYLQLPAPVNQTADSQISPLSQNRPSSSHIPLSRQFSHPLLLNIHRSCIAFSLDILLSLTLFSHTHAHTHTRTHNLAQHFSLAHFISHTKPLNTIFTTNHFTNAIGNKNPTSSAHFLFPLLLFSKLKPK